MSPLPITALVALAAACPVWLAATIDPAMFLGSACGTAHCWRCVALAADLAILIAVAVQRIAPKLIHA